MSSAVYSGTYSPAAEKSAPAFSFRDPIADAREMLRLAARVPFAASQPMSWHNRFRQHAAGARAAIRQHITRAGMPDSPINEIERSEPRLHAAIERQRDEHELLAAQADELVQEVSSAAAVDIWRMIELGEKAILLEMALARHHNRLVRLVYETTNRELGGEAG